MRSQVKALGWTCLPIPQQILVSEAGPHAGLIGAAAAARDAHLSPARLLSGGGAGAGGGGNNGGGGGEGSGELSSLLLVAAAAAATIGVALSRMK